MASRHGAPLICGADNVLYVRAHETLHNPKVQDALREVGYRMIRAASFSAIKNVETIANDLDHHDCLKVNLALLDRGGFAIETVHNVKVEREHRHQATINAEPALDVNFQEVVHSVQTRNSDVVQTSVILRRISLARPPE